MKEMKQIRAMSDLISVNADYLEKLQKIAEGVLKTESCDSERGGRCPFCYADKGFEYLQMDDYDHEPDCIYLLAKKLKDER